MVRLGWMILAGLLFGLPASAQTLVRGTVTDAATGEPLAAANLQIDGTYRGTITNAEGAYALRLETLPATLVVRYIGYETARIAVTAATTMPLDIRVQPVTYQLDEVVVSGEDPAIRIMREVIERKKRWRTALETYRADAYNRFTISNDTGIVSIIETFTDTFWDRERGMKETLKARRETANLELPDALPAALFVTNLYDDDVEVGGYELIGVAHPDALRHYDFRLEGTRRLDDQTVYDISVRPKNKLQSAFVGQVAVLDSAFALLEVALRPGAAFIFPPPIERYDVTYRQQFSNFGGDFWLPVDFRADLAIRFKLGALLAFPTFQIDQVSRFTDYAVNTPLPDSLYAQDDYLTVDSVAVASGSRLAQPGSAVPLSAPEQGAYAEIDSTMTLEKAFAPSGLLARFVRTETSRNDDGARVGTSADVGSLAFDLDPALWYNRVDAVHAGLEATVGLADLVSVRGGAGFSSGLDGSDRWSYQGALRVETGDDLEVFAEGGYRAGTALRNPSALYGRLLNGAAVLLGGDDYFDYYRREGFFGEVGARLWSLPLALELTAHYQREDHSPLRRTTSYDLLGTARLRPNPPVFDGEFDALGAAITLGDDFSPLGLFGRNQLTVRVESGTYRPGSLEFNYTRYDITADVRLPTFFRRRLLPNVLDVRLVAGTSTGDLPPQRLGLLDGGLGRYTPFGALKTRGGLPYEGDEYAGLLWEHNFRTVPFELLGLGGFVQRGYSLLLFGGHGRTWLADDNVATLPGFAPAVPDGFHHELGLSLSGLFGFLRADLAFRLDAPGVTVGVAAARIF